MKNKGTMGCLGNKNFCRDDEEINTYDINSQTNSEQSKTKVYEYATSRYYLFEDDEMLREKRDGEMDIVYSKERNDVLKYGKRCKK